MSIETFKSELSRVVQKGRDANKLLELQAEIIEGMKLDIAQQLAEVSVSKGAKSIKVFGISFDTRTWENLEGIEELQAELRVLSSYEDALKALLNDGVQAKTSLDELSNR